MRAQTTTAAAAIEAFGRSLRANIEPAIERAARELAKGLPSPEQVRALEQRIHDTLFAIRPKPARVDDTGEAKA